MTCTSLLLPGSTTPLLGRTQYFLGLVVLTLKATRSPVGLLSVSWQGTFLRSSNLRGGAQITRVGGGRGVGGEWQRCGEAWGAGLRRPHLNLSSVGSTVTKLSAIVRVSCRWAAAVH